MITELLGEDLKGRSPAKILVGEAVIKPCNMRNCKGPEPIIMSPIRGQVNHGVNHHGPCPVTGCLNCPFSMSVLMFSTNTRKGLCLLLVSTIIAKCFRNEDTIIMTIVDQNMTVDMTVPSTISSTVRDTSQSSPRYYELRNN